MTFSKDFDLTRSLTISKNFGSAITIDTKVFPSYAGKKFYSLPSMFSFHFILTQITLILFPDINMKNGLQTK